MTSSQLMQGKKGLIMGVANGHSIAWGIARTLAEHGAQLAFSYQGEALLRRVTPLAESVGSKMVYPCDVTDEKSLKELFASLKKEWGELDFVVHAIAFSDKEELKGRYIDSTRQNFLNSMDISVFSFTSVARHAEPMLKEGGSLLTLSFMGSVKVMPHYNVMGVAKAALEASVRYLAVDMGEKNIRVNCISAGPIRTLASAGISDFRYMQKWHEHNAPLKRNVSIDEVGGAALYLTSDLASAVTGEIHYVDSGYNIIGMKSITAPDLTLAKTEGE